MIKHFVARPTLSLRTLFLFNQGLHSSSHPLRAQPPTQTPNTPHRTYATKKTNLKSTASFIPSSKSPITNPTAREEYTKCETSIKAYVDYFRKKYAAAENREVVRVWHAW